MAKIRSFLLGLFVVNSNMLTLALYVVVLHLAANTCCLHTEEEESYQIHIDEMNVSHFTEFEINFLVCFTVHDV